MGRFSVEVLPIPSKGYTAELRDRVTGVLEPLRRKITLDALFETRLHADSELSPRCRTPFDRLFDEIVSPIKEDVWRDGGMYYAICVDRKGYAHSHNLRYSRPLTGDPAVDRPEITKRIFNDRTGIRCATNTELPAPDTHRGHG